MTHAKHTTVVSVDDLGDRIKVHSTIGEDGNSLPEKHYIPKLALCIRAAEYNLDPEDPRVLEMILRLHFHPETGSAKIENADGVPPLVFLPSVSEAADFIDERIEEVRVDRLAPAAETGNRLLAGAVGNKAATKALVSTRSLLLKAVDKRLVEPVQFYRDQARATYAEEAQVDPVERMLRRYRADAGKVPGLPMNAPPPAPTTLRR